MRSSLLENTLSIEFEYRRFPTEYLGSSRRPIAFVRMVSQSASVMIELIIDSGADISLVDSAVAEALELEPPTPEELYTIEGVGAGTPVYYRQLQMTIGEYTFPCRIGIVPYSSNMIRIMGQANVFDQFAIEFRRFEAKVIFTHQNE